MSRSIRERFCVVAQNVIRQDQSLEHERNRDDLAITTAGADTAARSHATVALSRSYAEPKS